MFSLVCIRKHVQADKRRFNLFNPLLEYVSFGNVNLKLFVWKQNESPDNHRGIEVIGAYTQFTLSPNEERVNLFYLSAKCIV